MLLTVVLSTCTWLRESPSVRNKIKTAEEALNVYRSKDVVANCFDDLKNHLDMKRLRVHTAPVMDGRLFLQSLALVYVSSIRTAIQADDKLRYLTDDKLRYLTVRELMEEMETLVRVNYSSRYGQVFTEITPIQRRIMDLFGIKLPE